MTCLSLKPLDLHLSVINANWYVPVLIPRIGGAHWCCADARKQDLEEAPDPCLHFSRRKRLSLPVHPFWWFISAAELITGSRRHSLHHCQGCRHDGHASAPTAPRSPRDLLLKGFDKEKQAAAFLRLWGKLLLPLPWGGGCETGNTCLGSEGDLVLESCLYPALRFPIAGFPS